MYIQNQFCGTCKTITFHTNFKCDVCTYREEKARKKKEAARWNALTLEQKVEELYQRLNYSCNYTETDTRLKY